MTANPTLLAMPLAQNGQKNVIPATQATAGDGLFSQSTGFPAETSLPLGAGGVAPSREDFNGMANLLGGVAYYAQKGWQFQFDAAQDYYEGCIVRDTTDGKLYECINDVAAGGSVPSADSVNWKEAGVDPSMFANPDLSNLSATGEDHFLEQDFTIIYPNGGSESSPAFIDSNSVYMENNPFPGYVVRCQVEVEINGVWGVVTPAQFYTSHYMGDGAICLQHNDGNLVLITGSSYIIDSYGSESGFCRVAFYSFTTDQTYPSGYSGTHLPCRVKVWKVGKVANS